MTLHIYTIFECKRCGHIIIELPPFKIVENCPKCGSTEKRPHLVLESITSWLYNRSQYGSGTPPFYYVGNTYDHVMYISWIFLDEYVQENPENPLEFIERFINKIAKSSSEETRNELRKYFKKLVVYYIAMTRMVGKSMGESDKKNRGS